MLSSIGRAAIRRVGAGASHPSTNRVLQSLRHLQRVDKSNNVASNSALYQFFTSFRRSYATTTQATKPKTKTSVTAKAKPKTKTAAPKKPVKKAVKKKAVAKPKPKAKPKKKVLTDEQKQKAELKALKATALTPPKGKPSTAWMVVLSEMMKKAAATPGGTTSVAKEAAARYKSLTTEELEHYNHIAHQNKMENESEYKKWIDSHKPEEIRLANNARNLLKKKASPSKRTSKYQLLQDPRIPKQPRNAWTLFGKERWSSGDLKGMSVVEGTRLVIKEWKELSPSQRKPYEDEEAAQKRQYIQEYRTVFGRDPKFIQDQQKAAA